MREGRISAYFGEGKGKTCVALGRGLRAVGDDMKVVMIQFMDYHNNKEVELLKKLEPDFRIFRFEKDRVPSEIDDVVRKEMASEIKNAYNFARKIVDTGECEMLVLDGILECVSESYLTEQSLLELIERVPSYMDVILTGDALPEKLAEKIDCIYQIVAEKR